MPWAAAAAVTSPSLAAPSSIEYSVCTCRCTKFSADDVPLLLTGTVLLRVVPARRGDAGGRPVGKTGGARAGVDGPSGLHPGAVSILALPRVYSEGPTERVSPRRDRSLTPAARPSRALGAWSRARSPLRDTR